MDWSSSKGDCPVLEQQQQQQQPFPANHTDEFSVDMKLGSVIAASQTRNSPVSLPSKRARAVSNSAQQSAYCLVDDCTSDLSNCREYHRRHKVCEVHSKTPEVTIQGNKQRFCQQCSRFHALDEFDEGKRSCRKRLDGHNRRRRKPQPETHLQQAGTYLPNFPGVGLLSFCNPSSSPTHALTWSGSVNESKDPYNRKPHLNLLDKQNPFTDNSSPRYKEAKQLTIFQGENQMNHRSTAQSSKHKVFYDGLTTQAPDSDCALSLLSRPMLPMHTTTTTEINFRNAIQMQTHKALPSSDQRSSHFSTLQPIVPVTDIDFHNMFHTGPDLPNRNINDQPQTLPFYWE